MDKIYDMIIIGGGPAGYSAALYAARAGLEVLLLERLAPGGQLLLTGEIENYPGFDEGIDGISLGMKIKKNAERFGAVSKFSEVTSVELNGKIKRISAKSGDFYAKTVVIATGADPRRLGIQGEKELVGKGVHYCAHCDGRFYKDKIAVVVGGGNSAASDALYLSRLVKKLYLIHRRDTLRAEKIFQKPLMSAENVEFLWNSKVTELLSDSRLCGIKITDTLNGKQSEIKCDGVFVSIGRTPVTGFLSGTELDKNGYIIADETTRTNIPGVFAAGDIRTKELRQIVTAAADGANAAHFAEKYLSELSE